MDDDLFNAQMGSKGSVSDSLSSEKGSDSPQADQQEIDSSAGEGPDVAVVIVNWNTRDLLRSCLRTLVEGKHKRIGRVIVVDNASSDGSASMVRAEFPGVDLIEPGANLFYAAGNNLALRSVSQRYALLLNPDTEVPDGAIDRLVCFLENHPSAAMVAPQLRHPNGEIQASCRGFPTPVALMAERLALSRFYRLYPFLGSYRIMGWNHDSERQVDQPMGTAILTRMSCVAEVGLMDEQFPLFYNEVDWQYRMKQAGWEIWFTPASWILHHGGCSTRQIRVRAACLSHLALHAFLKKHFRSQLQPVPYALIVISIYLHAAVAIALLTIERFKKALPKLQA